MLYLIVTFKNHLNRAMPISIFRLMFDIYFKGKNMVIYEVNLSIDRDVYAQFQLWLKEHVKEILQLPGFIKAHILKPENKNISGQEKLTVQYQLEDRASLNVYLTQFAVRMREEGINRFKDKFSAERRVFEVQESILR